MNVRPGGCLLSTLSLLALLGLGVVLVMALLASGFNDNGDPQAYGSINGFVSKLEWGMGLAAALLIFGLFWAWWRVPPAQPGEIHRSMRLSTAAWMCGALILCAWLYVKVNFGLF